MRLTLPYGAARWLGCVAIGVQLSVEIFLHMPWLYNAGWISVLAALLLCLPLALLSGIFTRASGAVPVASALEQCAGAGFARAVCALFVPVALEQGVVAADALIGSVRYVELSESPAVSLLLPLLLFAVPAALLNGQSLGGGARVWTRVAAPLLALVILEQLKCYRTQWLTPLLGPGVPLLARGALNGAGMLCPFVIVWLCSEPDERDAQRRGLLAVPVALVGLVCAGLAALYAMMAPAAVGASLSDGFQIDRLLSNGRASLLLQLPLVLLWYFGLLFCTAGNIFLAAKLAQLVVPKLDGRIAIVASGLLIGALTLVEDLSSALQGTHKWLYLAVTVPFFALMLPPLWKKGGKPPCEPSK